MIKSSKIKSRKVKPDLPGAPKKNSTKKIEKRSLWTTQQNSNTSRTTRQHRTNNLPQKLIFLTKKKSTGPNKA
jgi:hypothetical protein